MSLDDYTLIIPTYHRPKEFSALLKYLDEQKAGFKILVLDSSRPDVASENKKAIEQVALNVELLTFPSDMPPFEKFWKGVQHVKTAFCSLCADDDVLAIKSVNLIVEFLRKNPDYVAAHGLYFSFMAQDKITIADLVYTRDVLMDDDPINRLQNLFESYEAITYAIYRTPVLDKIFSQLQFLNSLLGRELLGGALTAAMGKVKRLPVLYCGRSMSASHFYESWHPVEMLMASPDALYQEYGRYRKILVDTLKSSGDFYSEEDFYKLVDIIHFSYMSEFLAPNILSYLTQQVLDKRTLSEIMTGLWPYIIQNQKDKVKDNSQEKGKFSFFKRKKLEPSPVSDLRFSEFENKPFKILNDFKTKLQPYMDKLSAPLEETLLVSMNNYFTSLKHQS